jgi:hypothetical protein
MGCLLRELIQPGMMSRYSKGGPCRWDLGIGLQVARMSRVLDCGPTGNTMIVLFSSFYAARSLHAARALGRHWIDAASRNVAPTIAPRLPSSLNSARKDEHRASRGRL